MKRVVVTGLGALTPIGNSVPAFKAGLEEGKSGADAITKFDPSSFKVRFACELKDFDVNQVLDRKVARRMDAFSQYAMVVADEAMEDSGLDLDRIDSDRAGVIWGSGIGGLRSLEKEIEENALRDSKPLYNPFMIPKMIVDIVPGHISIKYDLKGINYSTVSACASSTHALVNATDYIRMGRANVMVTGGSEAAVTKPGIGGFSSMKALSTRNDDPATASRPFDKDRDGFVLGEGSACIILEEYEHAKARGADIYGEVIGVGMTADAHHITAPHPEGDGAEKVMQLAMKDAEYNADQIDYINVHGTSTPLGDVAEVKAIKNVFGEAAYDLNISSTKSMTGHLLGAAGALEMVSGILGMNYDFIPPTINHFTDDPDIDSGLNFTFNEAQDRSIRAFISNTFGFGGHNSTVIIKKMN